MNAIQVLIEWGVRSFLLVLVGALLLWVLRVKDSSVRLAAWVAVLAGSLLIPLMTATLPSLPVRVMRAPPQGLAEQGLALASPQSDEPTLGGSVNRYDAAVEPRVLASPPINWRTLGVGIYGSVALVMLLRLLIGLALSRRLLGRSRTTGQTTAGIEVRESDQVAAPVTLGIVHPVIVLPADWSEWGQGKLDAVLAHEQSHVARRDPAVQLLSAIHRVLLWHNPLSWFLHFRIVSAAEDASDDAAVAVTADRVSYAEVLLDFMRRPALKSHLAGVPMARYGRPDGRIDRILDSANSSHGVTRWSVAAILVLGAPLSYLVASSRPELVVSRIAPSVGTVISPDLPLFDRLPEAPRLIAQVVPPPPTVPRPPEDRPKFDAVSIKPCDPSTQRPGGRGGPGATNRFRRNCVTIMSLIRDAYIRFDGGESRSPFMSPLTKIEGGPGWIDSDQYTIEGEAEHAYDPPVMFGPMTQMLLEDRLQLRVHRERRNGPVYELTAGKGGAKIQPAKGTPCAPEDFAGSPLPFLAGDERPCQLILSGRKGPNMVMTMRGLEVSQLIPLLTTFTDRLVIDKTGITGPVDLRLVFAPDENAPGVRPAPTDGVPVADDPVGPTLVTALQEQLGLKLEPARGNRDYLVIDSVSRPSPN